MTTCVFGEQLKKKRETVHLPNNTVKHHIEALSADTENSWHYDLNPALLCSCNLAK